MGQAQARARSLGGRAGVRRTAPQWSASSLGSQKRVSPEGASPAGRRVRRPPAETRRRLCSRSEGRLRTRLCSGRIE